MKLMMAAIAAIALGATGVALATTPAGATGGAPVVGNGVATFTVGDTSPVPNTFDAATLVSVGHRVGRSRLSDHRHPPAGVRCLVDRGLSVVVP